MAVLLNKYVEKMNLIPLTGSINTDSIEITVPDINRPALPLTGFYEFFDARRVQIIGQVEKSYIEGMDDMRRYAMLEKLFQTHFPCLVCCRNYKLDEKIIKLAEKYLVPCFYTDKNTSETMSETIRWLKVELAPLITVHGVLVDVYGEGVLIMGESGIGKSEAALELIKRGHRLVSDDVVEIRKVSDETLVGSAPDITRHFIELRGIGIINVKTLFGVESVKNTQSIDMVIKLEDWNKEKQYDRFGMDEKKIEFLGNSVNCYSIPIRPGRNLAIIVESAAVNNRQKMMGYNAAVELYNRAQNNIKNKLQER